MLRIKELLKSIYYRPNIQNIFLKVISPVFPEPENCTFAETRYGVWNTTSNLFQENGRQLGEANVHHGFRHRKFPIELRECKIEGSRKGVKTNLTALQDIMRNYNDSMQILMHIRNHYVETFALKNETFDAGTLFLFTQYVVSLPLYCARDKTRSKNNNQRIDPQVAVLFQLVAGVFNLIRRLLEDESENITINSAVNSERLYAFSEKKNLFTTPSDKSDETRVCGGAKKKIIELLDVLIKGRGNKNVFETDGKEFKVRNIDINHYLSYSLAALQLESAIQQCRLKSIYYFLKLDSKAIDPKIISNLQSYILDSEFGSIAESPFSDTNNKENYAKAIFYRINFYQTIIQEIQDLRNLIVDESISAHDSISFDLHVTTISSIEQLKITLNPIVKHYYQEINKLQLSILKILGNTNRPYFTHYFVTKRLSVFKAIIGNYD